MFVQYDGNLLPDVMYRTACLSSFPGTVVKQLCLVLIDFVNNSICVFPSLGNWNLFRWCVLYAGYSRDFIESVSMYSVLL